MTIGDPNRRVLSTHALRKFEEDPAVTAATPYVVLDIHCRPCGRPDRLGPRMGRFVRRTAGGGVGVQKFTANGETVIPYCHVRKDGGFTWYLLCPCGSELRVPEEQIAA